MAISKFTEYYSAHDLSDKLLAIMHYDVYTDMGNANANPYLRLTDCMIRTQSYEYAASNIQSKLPMVLSAKINSIYDPPDDQGDDHDDGDTTDQNDSGDSTDQNDVNTEGQNDVGNTTDQSDDDTEDQNDENQDDPNNDQSDDHGEGSNNDTVDEGSDNNTPDDENQNDLNDNQGSAPIDIWPTIYTCTINGSVSFHQGNTFDLDYNLYADSYYYINFTVPGNVLIPKDAEEFTINLTFAMPGEDSLEFVVHSFGPMANSLSGNTSIITETPSIFRFSRNIECNGNINNPHTGDRYLESTMSVYFNYTGGKTVWRTYEGYATPYRSSRRFNGIATEVGFVPRRWDVPVGTVSVSGDKTYVDIKYSGYSAEVFTRKPSHNLVNFPIDKYGGEKYVLITHLYTGIIVTSSSQVDQSLRPEFDSFQYSMTCNLNTHLLRFGAGVQNKSHYVAELSYRMKYGSTFYARGNGIVVIDDYKSGELYHDGVPTIGDGWVRYDGGLLTAPVSNAPIIYTLTDSFGFTVTYTDYVNVLPYTEPKITTHDARRCSAVSGGVGSEYYDYDGVTYKIDDNGDHVLIEWGTSISPLENLNYKSFWIYEPRQDEPTQWSPGWTVRRDIQLQGYSDSGYYVVPADVEKSYDIVFHVADYFRGETNEIYYTVPLNTAIAAIDFLSGGFGLAFGKVAEFDHIVDFHRNWTIHMPYETMVQNYNQNGTAVRLYDWIGTVNQRIKNITDSRDVAIFDRYRFYDGNEATCVPNTNGTVRYPVEHSGIELTATGSNTVVGMLIGDNVTIQRNYLYLTLFGRSWVSSQFNTVTGVLPHVYFMSTKPTTINQSTGQPNGTIIKSIEIVGSINSVGSPFDGYTFMSVYQGGGSPEYIDVSQLKGQKVWIVVTIRNTDYNQTGSVQYSGDMYMNAEYIYQTNNRRT